MKIVPAVVLAALIGTPVAAAELKVGSRIEALMDPHYFFSSNYLQYYRHYLGFLTVLDPSAKVVASLAEGWEQTPNGWVVKLRKGVTFTDGSAFDAKDVIASYERARDYPKAAGSYAGLLANVSGTAATDENTITFTTSAPYPTFPFALSQIPIIPSEVAATASQADFTSKKGSVSSGPFAFDSYSPGRELVLMKNAAYRGETPPWDKVTFRFIPDPAARVAALLGGDVDLIDGVPPEFAERIRKDPNFSVHTGPSMRNVFVGMDLGRDVSPFIFGNDGSPLSKNPLKDARVRNALSLAISREAIRDRVMGGLSFPTGQLVAKGIGGYSDALTVPTYDPAKGKALLAEAGYPDGFKITLHCTNDRYVNDAKICQALGQMFARVGVRAEVVTLPSSAFFKLVNPSLGEGGSLFLFSWSAASSGEADVLTSVFHTFDPAKKMGSWNLGRYSNPELDALLTTASGTQDPTERRALQAQAMKMVMENYVALPLHDQSVVVASRKSLDYTTNLEDITNVLMVRQKP
jgi:peptide/nickel transport system substrate-binding protein